MLTGRDEEALEEVAAVHQQPRAARRLSRVLDLREPRRPAALVEAARREFGGLDILDQQCRHHQARRFLRAHRRRLGGRLCAEVLRPCAAGARRLAAAQGAPRRRWSRSAAPAAASRRALHHRQLGQRRGGGLHQMPRRSRQGRRRAGQLHPSEPGRDRAAVAAHPRRDRANRRAEDKVPRAICRETGIIAFRHGRGRRRPRHLHGVARATWLHGATIDLDGGEIPVL